MIYSLYDIMPVYLRSASSSLISDNVKFTGEICYANQLTGFYIRGTLIINELMLYEIVWDLGDADINAWHENLHDNKNKRKGFHVEEDSSEEEPFKNGKLLSHNVILLIVWYSDTLILFNYMKWILMFDKGEGRKMKCTLWVGQSAHLALNGRFIFIIKSAPPRNYFMWDTYNFCEIKSGRKSWDISYPYISHQVLTAFGTF